MAALQLQGLLEWGLEVGWGLNLIQSDYSVVPANYKPCILGAPPQSIRERIFVAKVCLKPLKFFKFFVLWVYFVNDSGLAHADSKDVDVLKTIVKI